ncbi:MAG: phosphoribosylaminoimidazolesuccinocarboxamide synthase, partial [Deltaproteobacteria bacterium]|nr:phosphoribosylaminoimidazolesuccinocarboxamide synthase [Deltaproteobacteria bacterium]
FIVTTDRISAFDRVLGTLPLKGQLLQWVSAFWFDRTRARIPNHLLATPDPNVMEVKECQPLGAEMVVRAYVTGVTGTSLWTHYARGERTFCGHTLPDGLRKDERLERPLLTPSTKAAHGEHDVSMSKDELIRGGHIDGADFEAAEALVMALFEEGQRHCAERGLILVDTKYELGKDVDGNVVVIDEVHTPDSSRFWFAASYAERFDAGRPPESFDKEHVRRWLVEHGFTGDGPTPTIPDEVKLEAMARYATACEAIVGEPFAPDCSEPLARIRKNLKIEGP